MKHDNYLPAHPGRSSALYAVITSTRTGEILGRVRLDAADAPERMKEMLDKADGAVTIRREESESAEAGASCCDARRPPPAWGRQGAAA